MDCAICGEAFSLIIRRRICRRCKRNCCINCIDKNYVHPASGSARTGDSDPAETCVDCILTDATNYSISVQEELDVTEEINRGLKNELKRQLVAMEKFRAFLVEFCQSFAPEKSIIGGDEEKYVTKDEEENIDPTQPIANLVDLGSMCLQNLYARVKIMKSELDAARKDRDALQHTLTQKQQHLEAVSRERDSMQMALHRINETVIRLEAEQQHIADLRREYDALRVRCLKMERQQNEVLTRQYATSLPRQSVSQDTRSHNMALFSLCCPRIGF
ncbi:FYVE zinc finger domain-containing protein [Babesia ovis]|uniref:FYVE zinc finger domain-containing protein n=1 Tax=Babesia ovis TaxID=5869 RepID=A0A9W5TC80_BABOV|nr:FYVE zinc finger domain-containing protein [Babesia ovis]